MFLDGGKLPCVLVENKIDVLPEEEQKNDGPLKKFAEENQFVGAFRTSAKEGININESMEYLIKTIISRMEKMSEAEGKDAFEQNRKSVALDPKQHVSNPSKKKKDDKCC